MMYHCMDIERSFPSNTKDLENVIHAAQHQPIHHGQEHAEKEDGDNHYARRGDDVIAARPSNLLHLHAHVVQELPGLRDAAGNPSAKRAGRLGDSPLGGFISYFYSLRSHTDLLPDRRQACPSLAGEEGFEPPYPVLETGVLTVGRLPSNRLPWASHSQPLLRPRAIPRPQAHCLTSLPYAQCVYGRYCKTSWSPD